MPEYQLITHSVGAMQFDGTVQGYHGLQEWAKELDWSFLATRGQSNTFSSMLLGDFSMQEIAIADGMITGFCHPVALTVRAWDEAEGKYVVVPPLYFAVQSQNGGFYTEEPCLFLMKYAAK